MKKRIIKNEPRFGLRQLEGWSLNQLRWGRSRTEEVWGEGQEFCLRCPSGVQVNIPTVD